MIRWIGAFFIIYTTSYMGIEYSKNLQKRICELNVIKKIFLDLYSDVEYGACTLTESFERIAKKQDSLYENFLDEICRRMKLGNGMSFGAILSDAVEQKMRGSVLRDSDKEHLIQLGWQVGNNQRKGQLRILHLYIQELDDLIKELEKTKQEKQKLSRVLGVSSGVLIVILLL